MITVFVVTDDPDVRATLFGRFAMEPDVLVMGEAASVMRALEDVPDIAPQVIVLDGDAPGGDLDSSAQLLRSVSPGSAVIVLAVSDIWNRRSLNARIDGIMFVPDWDSGGALMAAVRRSTFHAA